jgi:hypothetical protein
MRGRAGNAIGIAEPVEQVAVPAALAAKGLVCGSACFAAERAVIGFGVRHLVHMGGVAHARKRLTDRFFRPI